MINFSPAAGSCWKVRPTWPLSLSKSRPFWTYSPNLVSSKLQTFDNHHTARIPHLEHWTVLRSSVTEEQMDRRNHPLHTCLLLQAIQHGPAEAEKDVWPSMLFMALTASESPVLQHSQHEQLTNFLKAAFQIVAYLLGFAVLKAL